MLVLSRRRGETIVIDDQIELTVLDVEGDIVRLGISAPKDIKIVRKEIYVAIKEANRDAVSPSTVDISSLFTKLKKK